MLNTCLSFTRDQLWRVLGTITEVCRPVQKPVFSSHHHIIKETNAYRLLMFSDGSGPATLILPPQAGHHSAVCDLSPDNSLIQCLLNNGVQNLYVVDWKTATPDRAKESLGDLITFTFECVQAIGGLVHLVGLCQGGWQAAIFSALYPESVKSLVVAGSPINTHVGDSKIQRSLTYTPLSWFRNVVRMNDGLWPGGMQLLGFKLMNPMDRFWLDYVDIFVHYSEEVYMVKNRTFRNWYEYTQALPGRWFLEAVEELFYGNKLYNGNLHIQGQKVSLNTIQCPVTMIAGAKDDVTPPEQVFALNDKLDVDTENYLVDSGHIGLFMGSLALKTVWPEVAKTLH